MSGAHVRMHHYVSRTCAAGVVSPCLSRPPVSSRSARRSRPSWPLLLLLLLLVVVTDPVLARPTCLRHLYVPNPRRSHRLGEPAYNAYAHVPCADRP
ncbi:hypothetical protein GGS23DRAFT_458033 [Durotheca rogersii]|uniref:uncharacterized protein n=1 Tax=Durotheca rogersii TaxID=419775 RepID=UPI00221F3B72|nr:uncharacterized protein GGS23DRAFT_458033 [Durotheca rogersii]KAI5864646.1 hypothetical protein GGS23DRAFT_458033 [Durotheca rogersii]